MRSLYILSIALVATPLLACQTVAAGRLDGSSYATLHTEPHKTTAKRARNGAHPESGKYFVEFRSRYALSYGHTFLVHGRLNRNGEVGELSARNVAGFHPAGDGPQLWSVGHLVPVPAETGPSDGDLEEEYVSARFRVILSEAQYKKVAAYVKEKQASSTPWHAALYNCNAWVGDVARFAGLQAPTNHLLYPADYINEMRRLNTVQARSSSAHSPPALDETAQNASR
jgi:hypothetical protein